MKKKWQVCELEESSNIDLTLFERFSVVAVPENWILLLENGTLVCFWPSVDPGKKIRSLHDPKAAEKCAYYKCRILLDGAKFSTYKKAKEAETIAQNVSSIMDTSALLESQENICDSTMEFDVSEADVEKNDGITDPDELGFAVSDADMDEKANDSGNLGSFGFIVSSDDEIVGQDSFNYNKEILKGIPRNSKKAMDFEVENLSESEFECSGYSANFKSNDANFLTSTVIDESDFLQNINKSELYEIISKISAIVTKVSLFVESIRNDLNELKEALGPEKKREISSAHNKEKNALKSDSPVQKNNIPFNGNFDSDGEYSESGEEPEAQFSNGNECDESHVQHTNIEKVLEKSDVQRTKVGEVPLNTEATPADKQNINETFAYDSAIHANDGFYSQRPKILSIEVLHLPTVRRSQNEVDVVVPVKNHFNGEVDDAHKTADNVLKLPIGNPDAYERNEELLKEDGFEADIVVPVANHFNDDAHKIPTKTADNVLKLPIGNPDAYAENEELLEEDGFEAALIKHLEPYTDEDETSYMNRTILTLFTENFFLSSVSWKNERDRINIKHSNILCCWKVSFAKKFEENVDNIKFMEHFRRFKSAKRAAVKAQLKRLNNTKSKTLKK